VREKKNCLFFVFCDAIRRVQWWFSVLSVVAGVVCCGWCKVAGMVQQPSVKKINKKIPGI
jgi:hypothetical protein